MCLRGVVISLALWPDERVPARCSSAPWSSRRGITQIRSATPKSFQGSDAAQRRLLRAPSFRTVNDCSMNFLDNFSEIVPKFPAGIVLLKFCDVADPPDVVTDPVRLFVLPPQFVSADLL